MKTIALSSDLTLESERGTIRIVTQSDTIRIDAANWRVFSLLIQALKKNIPFRLSEVRNKALFLAQPVRLSVKNKHVVTIQEGKLRSFGFIPLLRAAFIYITA